MKLKYLCSSFSTPLAQSEVKEEGPYKVYGASGLAGYLDTYIMPQPYLGIVKDGAGVGRVNCYNSNSSLLGTLAYIVPTERADINWLKYVIMSLELGKDVAKTTIPHIYFSEYGNRDVSLYVSIEQQRRLATFLDAECSRIDSVIEQTRASIEEYKKLKHSVIIQAVTKGIRPNRKMKDSGIEWIGEIAADFELTKLKYICDVLDQLRSPITADQRNQDAEVLYEYYGASGPIDKIDGYTIDDHVMLIGEDGANLKMRNLPLIYEVNGKAWINNHAHILRPKADVHFYYLFFTLEALDINPYITGSAQPKLSQDNLKNIWLPIPAFAEQEEIAKYLQRKIPILDALLEQKKRFISDMESYKQSFIYEYVTGKKEVM